MPVKKKAAPQPVVLVKKPAKLRGKARVLSSKTVYKGKVFSVTADQVEEPGGVSARRDVIRQYRHATGQFLLEVPAGRMEPGEKLLPAARRELIEETGYRAKKWSKYVRYFASPGFLSEAMNVLLAEELTLGDAEPEDDERIEILMTPLSEVLRLIHAGKILDGKTLVAVLLYDSLHREQ